MKGERVYSGDILKKRAKCCILVLLVKCRFSTRRVNSSEVWFLRAVQKSCLRTIAKRCLYAESFANCLFVKMAYELETKALFVSSHKGQDFDLIQISKRCRMSV